MLSLLALALAAQPAAPPAAPGGYDFGEEARLMYRVVACGGDAPLPPDLDADVVAAHCRELGPRLAKLRERFVVPMKPFLAGLAPPDVPKRVVYPFGGGDLLGALTTYSSATEITTISLEAAGDPRHLAHLDKRDLASNLEHFREVVSRLLESADLDTPHLTALQEGVIPGQLAYFLVALQVFDYEPVSLRFFTINDDGSLHYLDQAEIAGLEKKRAGRIGDTDMADRYVDNDFSVAFDNAELTFRPRGAGPDAPVIVHRHIAANLDNPHLRKNVGLMHYLEQRGSIAAMVKAGTYLLWWSSFSVIRDYLLDHMAFMICDCTGILPKDALPRGFELTTYGRFTGSFVKNDPGHETEALKEVFDGRPYRPMPRRYSFTDSKGSAHLMTYRRTAPP